MIDALRSYLQLASGLAEVSAGRAKEAATALVTQGVEVSAKGPGDITQQVQGIAEDLVEQGRTNREILSGLIKTEVDRTIGRMGFVREEELAAVRKHVQRLETQLGLVSGQAVGVANGAMAAATSGAKNAATNAKVAATAAKDTARTAGRTAAGAARPTPKPTRATPAAPKAPAAAKKTAARKPVAEKTAVKKSVARKPAAKRPTVKKTVAKKSSPARKR